MPCHVHHPRTHYRAHKHAHRGYEYDGLKLCHLGSDGRIEEVDSIVADSHKQVKHRQNKQEDHDNQINCFHKTLCFVQKIAAKLSNLFCILAKCMFHLYYNIRNAGHKGRP